MLDYVAVPFTVGFDCSDCEDFDERESSRAGLKQLGEMIVRMGAILTQPSPSQVGGTKFGACFVVERMHAEAIFGRLSPDPISARYGVFDLVYPPGGIALRTGGHIWNSPDGDWENGGQEIKAIELAVAFERASETPAELKDRQQTLWQARMSATPEFARRDDETEWDYISRLNQPFNRLLGPYSASASHLPPTLDRLPQPGEATNEWAARVAVDGQGLTDAMDLFERCDKDPQFYLALRPSAEETQLEFAVPGLIPSGMVTLVVGAGGTGKSTLASELCALIGSQSPGERVFLGQPISAQGDTMLFSGEDTASLLMERQEFYQRQGHANGSQCFFIAAQNLNLDACLSFARQYKGRLKVVVFDTASKFFTSSNDNDAIDPQIGKLEALAAELGCAVVLVHHLNKGVVRRFEDMREAIRGAGAFVTRPRMVIGIRRKGSQAARLVEIGILKHNMPPSQELWGELGKGRLFYQNPETLRLDPIDNGLAITGRAPASGETAELGIQQWVLHAVRERTASGGEVRKTGSKSLFQNQVGGGSYYSRMAIERAQNALIAGGQLRDSNDGLKIADPCTG